MKLLDGLRGRLAEAGRNTLYRLSRPRDGLPLPPSDLRHLVIASRDLRGFVDSGRATADYIRAALLRHNVKVEALGSLLDFGCGCGRVIRHWHTLPRTRVCGSDYNPVLVRWCQEHLKFAKFSVNQLAPPLPYPDRTFDLIYAISVFTHLPEPLQDAWLSEAFRITAPGGHVLITTHGTGVADVLPPPLKARFEAGEFVVLQGERPGTNDCAAFHPEPYVRKWAAACGLELAEFAPQGTGSAGRHKDIILFRRPL